MSEEGERNRQHLQGCGRPPAASGWTVKPAEHPVTWWPHMRLCAAIMMDFIPEAHTLLMVVAGVLSDKPEENIG